MKNEIISAIKADPFYSKYFAVWLQSNSYLTLSSSIDKGIEKMIEDGFFHNKANVNFDDALKVMCTPLNTISQNYRENEDHPKKCVVLTTGAFCPVHEGHVLGMEKAKLALEEKGWLVLGGYMSAGHDEYISEKVGERKLSTNERNHLVYQITKDIDWIDVDVWESQFTSGSVNFTFVYERLKQYIQHYVANDIEVFYVCGGDNARFSVLANYGMNFVVLNRGGHEATYHLNKAKHQSENAIYVDEVFSSLSSTQIRNSSSYQRNLPKEKCYLTLRKNKDVKDIDEAFLDDRICNALSKRFKGTFDLFIEDQLETFNEFDNTNLWIVSLDSLMKSDYFNFEISRHYDLFGTKFLQYGNRPNSKNIEQQVIDFDWNGGHSEVNWMLFDDDICSGGTIRFAIEKLFHKNSKHKLQCVSSFQMNRENHEVLDLRDFYIGEQNNGLVVKLPNNRITRAPYIYPFVDCYERASIEDGIQFSLEVWKANLIYWIANDRNLSHRDEQYQLFCWAGFGKDSKMSEICKYYVTLLENILNNK